MDVLICREYDSYEFEIERNLLAYVWLYLFQFSFIFEVILLFFPLG